MVDRWADQKVVQRAVEMAVLMVVQRAELTAVRMVDHWAGHLAGPTVVQKADSTAARMVVYWAGHLAAPTVVQTGCADG